MEEIESSLDASQYLPATTHYEAAFKQLLLNIYSCYQLMIVDNIRVPANDENTIRDRLLEYLQNTEIRQEICIISGFRFDKEVDEGTGRVDIKIININDFEEHEAYYIIECKRLDGTGVLNRNYVAQGINRFTTNYYSSHYGVNGMIGFVVAHFDIDGNMRNIETFFHVLEKDKLYESIHRDLKLYHLMMDFSSNVI